MHDEEEEGERRFQKRRAAPVRRGFLSRVGGWLLGAILAGIVPLAVSLWVRSLLADYVPMLEQATPAAAAGNAAVVAVSFSLAMFLELYVYWKGGPSAGRADEAPITGRLQFLITYVLVPLVPGLVVGYLTLSPANRLSQAVDWIRRPSGAQVEHQVGQAIADATADATRLAGLRALAQFGSTDALNELARLARGNPGLLNNPASFDALASALASFGAQSEPLLQAVWKESGRAGAGSTPEQGKTPADLVLAAFNRLERIADTAAAYGIAREAAVAPSSSPERRAAAIALVAKSGSRSDVVWLASLLVDQPEPVKQAVLDALRHLDARLRKQDVQPAAGAPATPTPPARPPNAPPPVAADDKGRISFAQQGEDLILYDLLHHVLKLKNPSYLDIGAGDPVLGNNTYVLYGTGSRGVLVEPNPTLTERLKRVRPGDVVVNAGVGIRDAGEADYYVIRGQWPLNTFSPEDVAMLRKQYKEDPVEKVIRMPLIQINRLIAERFQTAPDLLSIDIEGMDLDVLKSMDFKTHRPAAICAETKKPWEPHDSTAIAQFLRTKGYVPCAGSLYNTIFADGRRLAAARRAS